MAGERKMNEQDEYATNWHKYDEADEIFKNVEKACEALQKFPDDLHRTLVTGQAYKTLQIAKQLLDEMYYLRRLCDQHAG